MKKLVVILTGGGAKGAFQAGAWNKIQQLGINFNGEIQKIDVPHGVFGVSAGALNGAMIAMGKSKELYKLWNRIAGNPSEIYLSDFLKTQGNQTYLDTQAVGKYLLGDISFLQKLGLMFKKSRSKTLHQLLEKLKALPSLATNQPLFEKLQNLIHIKDVKSEVFQSGSVSLVNGQYYSLKHGDFESDLDFQKSVLASSSIPLVWSPVESIKSYDFELQHLIDGGMRNVNPLCDAVKYVNEQNTDNEYYFLLISCHSESTTMMQEKPNLLNILKRSIYDIAMNEINDSDLSEFIRINELVKQANAKGINLYSKSGRILKSFQFKIIQPLRELGSALNFSRSAVMDSYLHGFQVAERVIESPNWD